MGTNMKRFLMMLATLVLLVSVLATGVFAEGADPHCYQHGDVDGDGEITSNDAIYLLYSTFASFKDDYPLNQDGNFDGDESGAVTSDDAYYVLFSSFESFKNEYPLKGMIHSYHEPAWSWNDRDGKAAVTVKCGCPDSEHVFDFDAEEIKVEETASKDPTCVDAGSVTYKATIELDDGTVFEQTHTVIVPAGDHTVTGTQSCESAVLCDVCGDEVLPALGHDMKLVSTTPATCQAEGSMLYRCQNSGCTESKTETLDETACTYVYSETKQTGCTYTKYYKCSVCQTETAGNEETDVYQQHNLEAELTIEATCKQDGEKVYTCTACDYSGTQTVPADANAHTWGAGVPGDGMITYTCSGCGTIKTAVDATAAVTTEALAANEELAVDGQGTTVQLDETAKSTISASGATSIEISVETVTNVEDILKEDDLAKLGANAVVYDFNMFVVDENGDRVTDEDGNERTISQFGETAAVTVSLPYTLADGEDVDSINIWFVADDGALTPIKGTYANGFVTFTTNHFSYYTVTRLTPAERCELYGHVVVNSNTPATCVSEGHDKEYCQRCGKVYADVKTNPKGHDYEEQITAATCTTTGTKVETCKTCSHRVTSTIFALGHDYQKSEDKSTAATCDAAGETVYVCSHDDTHTRTEKVAQLQHDYKKVEDVAATCQTNGYTLQKCELCGDEKKVGEITALGHSYTKAEWTWDESDYSAAVKLTCANDATHTLTQNAVVSTNISGCITNGYNAVASYNNVKYTDTYEFEEAVANHKPSADWESNASFHWHVCTNANCGAELGKASHTWGEETVTKAPTCKNAGTAEVSCTVCEYTTTKSIPATGEHTFDSEGVCTVCGYVEGACDHLRTHREDVDLSGFDLCDGAEVWYMVCDCGQNQVLSWTFNSQFEPAESTTGTLPNGEEIELWNEVCTTCGLTVTYGEYNEVDETACTNNIYPYEKLSLNGVTIAELLYPKSVMSRNHPADPDTQVVVDLAEYGLCGGTVELYDCYCGKSAHGYENYVNEGNCNWEWQEEALAKVCSVCGAQKTDHYSQVSSNDSCEAHEIGTTTYFVNGAEVYAYTTDYYWLEHVYELVSYEMDGTSCEDGVMVTEACTKCGETNKYYSNWHTRVTHTVTDVSDIEFCADTVTVSVCACGDQRSVSFDQDCNWSWVKGGENSWTYECTECGAQRVEVTTYGEKDAECACEVTETMTYTGKNGEHIATSVSKYTGTNHSNKSSYKLLGESCTDGVQITQACEDCGEVMDTNTIYTHDVVVELERYDLSGFDSCFTAVTVRECACGKETGTSWDGDGQPCNFQWQDGYGICANCGLKWAETYTPGAVIDDCHYNQTITNEFSKENCESLTFSFDTVAADHVNDIYELTLVEGATDCTGGVNVTMSCDACGETENRGTRYYHETHVTSREVLYDGDALCGTPVKVTYSCGCGYSSWTNIEWQDGECNGFSWYAYNEAEDAPVYQCSTCGVLRMQKYTMTPVEDGEPCQTLYTDEYRYYLNTEAYEAGNVLFSYSSENYGYDHKRVYTYTYADENNQTCEGGYYVSGTCVTCGDSFTDSNIRYDESYYTVEIDVVHDGTGLCGPIEWRKNACACGYSSWYAEGDYCSWTWSDEDACEVCTVCGLKRSMVGNDTKVDGKCQSMNTRTVTYTLPDGTVLSRQYVSLEEDHIVETSFQLLGETCEDGYYLTQSCVNCDYSYTWEDVRYGHGHFTIKAYDLSDYGMCEGEIGISGCACGQSTSSWMNTNCDMNFTGETDADTGLNILHCPTCDRSFITDEIGEFDAENCLYTGEYYFKVFDADGNVLVSDSTPVQNKRHTELAYDFALNGQTCSDGYTAYMQCAYCGEQWTNIMDPYEGDWHNTYSTQVPVDLSQYGACGDSQIRVGQCPCGEVTSVDHALTCYEYGLEWVDDWTETGADGLNYHYNQHKCSECGLIRTTKDWIEQDANDPCAAIQYYTYTYTMEGNAELNAAFHQTVSVETHDYTVTHQELVEGGTSCEDGVLITNTCKNCDYSYVGNNSWHNVDVVETIDLAQYGAVCGSVLEHYSCVCGVYQRYDIHGEDVPCDLDQRSVESWITGAIESTDMETTAGTHWIDSGFYTITCAVTDPEACGLKIRMAEYWMQEGCEAVEYQVWQLGYDETTGQYQEELSIPTGERYVFHSYAQTNTTETLDDGTELTTDRWDCPTCKSYKEVKYWYLNGTKIKETDERVNTLYADNDDPQHYFRNWEYGLEANGHRYITLHYSEKVEANGDIWWENYEYTYDFTNGCSRTYTATDSNGNSWSDTEDAHIVTWTNEREEPTCSQPGYSAWFNLCDVCNGRFDGYTDVLTPYHRWSYDSDKEIYVCDLCNLENENGADGTIVMEDLTDDYSDGNYVVGYYNKGEGEFSAYVSVILENVQEGENDQLVLTGIDFTYWTEDTNGVNAVVFSQSQAQAAAEAAIADAAYTGSYAIRINMVPVDEAGTLDYAITFDSQTTAV